MRQSKLIFVAVFVLILIAAHQRSTTAANGTTPTLNALYWLNEFARLESLYGAQWEITTAPCIELPLRNGSVLTWRDARNALPAYLDMYLWSGDPVYLDRFVERAHQILSYRQDIDGDGLLGWPGGRGEVLTEQLVYDMAIAGVLARFANIAPEHPDAGLFRAVAEEIAVKWSGDWDGNLYTQPRNGTIPGARGHAYNIQAIAGLLHYELGHTEHVEAISQTLHNAMYPHPTLPGAAVWQYAPDPFGVSIASTDVWYEVEDINHAGATISFAAIAMPDMLDSLRLTTLGIWDGNQHFAWRIDGTEDLPPDDLPYDHYLPFYRHMELGPALYPAIVAQWTQLLNPEIKNCKPGSYMSIPALVLLHKFPMRHQVWLPMIVK